MFKSTSSKTVSSLNLKREISEDEEFVFKESEALQTSHLLQPTDDKLNNGPILLDFKNDVNNICELNSVNRQLMTEDDNKSLSQAGFSTRSHKNSQISSNMLSSKDFMSLNDQIRSVNQLNHSFRFNHNMPRYEFYNEQRNFKKQLNQQSESQNLLANQLASMNILFGINNQSSSQSYIQNQNFADQIKYDKKNNPVEELYQNFDLKYFD